MIWPRLAHLQHRHRGWCGPPAQGGRMRPTRWKMRPDEGQGRVGPRGVPWGSLHSRVTSGAQEGVSGGLWAVGHRAASSS